MKATSVSPDGQLNQNFTTRKLPIKLSFVPTWGQRCCGLVWARGHMGPALALAPQAHLLLAAWGSMVFPGGPPAMDQTVFLGSLLLAILVGHQDTRPS